MIHSLSVGYDYLGWRYERNVFIDGIVIIVTNSHNYVSSTEDSVHGFGKNNMQAAFSDLLPTESMHSKVLISLQAR